MNVELEVGSKKSRENKTFIFLLKSYSSLLILGYTKFRHLE